MEYPILLHSVNDLEKVGDYAKNIVGYAYDKSKIQLEKVILNKQVDLRNPLNLHTGRLLCDVFVDGDDVREHLGSERE